MDLFFRHRFGIICPLSHGDQGAIALASLAGFLIAWLLIAILSPNRKSKINHAYLLVAMVVIIGGFLFLRTADFVKKKRGS